MKFLLYILTFFPLAALAQLNLAGTVNDAKTKLPLPYCAIGLKHKASGTLTNEDGTFKFTSLNISDTLEINYIGYKKKQLPVAELMKNPQIYLQQKETTLDEVVVYSENMAYLYSLFETCRARLQVSENFKSKIYFVLESSIGNQPVELLEYYYNGAFSNSAIEYLTFKNGRAGIAQFDSSFFISLDISKAFTGINLLEPGNRMPAIPFQCSKKKLKKLYRLTNAGGAGDSLAHIKFTPIASDGKSFGGEAWIDKATGSLRKIVLSCQDAAVYPFMPLFPGSTVKDVSMEITKTFDNSKGAPEHLDFNYRLNYSSENLQKQIQTKGVMYFYDYGKLFIPPYFDYDENLGDYRKIVSLSYNDLFWASNSGLLYSEKRKKDILYFKNNGIVLNYKSANNNRSGLFKDGFFEINFLKWDPVKRISLKTDGIKNDTTATVKGGQFTSDLYNLKAQIFLDVNEFNDSLQHYSACIFDVYNTYYNLKSDRFTNCFINIYFDLFEIERRSMEEAIRKNGQTPAQLKAAYNNAKANAEATAAKYISELERGKNINALVKWNSYVAERLNVDNLKIFGLTGR